MAKKKIQHSRQARQFRAGKYRHYKGNKYEALGIVVHTETLEELVLYRPLSGELTWVRPLKMFLETVEVDGRKQPRFAYLGK